VKRVLVLDDEEVVRQLIAEILIRAGYAVEAVDVAAAALERLAAEPFDCVVTDLVMPGLSGLELLRRVREHDDRLPVVVVTGQGTDENLARAVELGATAVIVKPFTHAELRSAVASAVER
jgi:CheY-like chemotaxis protein